MQLLNGSVFWEITASMNLLLLKKTAAQIWCSMLSYGATCAWTHMLQKWAYVHTYPHYTYVFFLLFVSDLQLYYIERSKCWLSLRVGRYETLGLRSGLLDKTQSTQQLWDPSLFPLLHFAYRQVLSLSVRGKHLLTSMLTIFPMPFLLIVFDISALT